MAELDFHDQVEWRVSDRPVAYPDAVDFMERRVEAIRSGSANETVWLLEHPPLYTAGTSARAGDLLHPDALPVYQTGRGGRMTYHGPGQRVAYVMLDIRRRGADIRDFVRRLETWLIQALAGLGIAAMCKPGRVGVWIIRADGSEAKIAAIGVRIRRWVSYHGVAVNVAPNLEHFNGIIPCGLAAYPVTSIRALGFDASMADLDRTLRESFGCCFAADFRFPGVQPSSNMIEQVVP